MRTLPLIAVCAVWAVWAACAPDVPSVADRANASDLADQRALERQLLALPNVTGAHALLHRAVTDPLTNATSPASASVVITVARGDHVVIEAAAHRLAPTATVVLADAPAPKREKPFAAIAALVVILGAAGYVAWRTRPTA